MNRKDSFVKFLIESGPEWDIYRSHDGETMSFKVMKVCGDRSDSQFVPILAKSIEVKVEIDYVSAPIHTTVKPFRGVIVETVSGESKMPGFEDDIGMVFLSKGAGVEVEYNVNTRTGYLTFKSHHDGGHVRAVVHDGFVSLLQCKRDVQHYKQSELCGELAYYARLHDCNMNYSEIKTIGELWQCVELNFDGDKTAVGIDSVCYDSPIIWM